MASEEGVRETLIKPKINICLPDLFRSLRDVVSIIYSFNHSIIILLRPYGTFSSFEPRASSFLLPHAVRMAAPTLTGGEGKPVSVRRT